MRSDLRRVVIDEVTDAMMRDAAQLGPVAERGDRGLFVFRKNPAEAQAEDVRELIFCGGSELCFHTPACWSRTARRAWLLLGRNGQEPNDWRWLGGGV